MNKILASQTMYCQEGPIGEKGSKNKEYFIQISKIGPNLWSVDGKSGKRGMCNTPRPQGTFDNENEAWEVYHNVILTREKHNYKTLSRVR